MPGTWLGSSFREGLEADAGRVEGIPELTAAASDDRWQALAVSRLLPQSPGISGMILYKNY